MLCVKDIHPKEALPLIAAELEAHFRGEETLGSNIPCLRKDGTTFYAEISAGKLTIDGALCHVTTFRDVTERKRAEEEASRMVTVVRDSNDAITIQDVGGKIMAWNHGAELMYGYSEQEAMQMTILQFVPHAKAEEQKDFNRRIFAGEKVSSFETQRLTKDGRLLDVWLVVTKLIDNAGKVIGIASTERDVTERKKAEEELHKLSRAVEQSPVSIVITDFEGRIEYVNPYFERTTGYTRQEALGQNPRILKSGEEPSGGYRALWEALVSGREWRGEFHNKKKSGELFWESASISPVKDDAGRITHFVAVKEDITARRQALAEREQLQAQFLQSQKMEVVGRLAGGVAHDFNNLLTAILGNCSFLLDDLPKDDPKRADVEDIRSAGERAANLTRQLLAFSRKQVMQLKALDLNAVLADMEKLIRRLIGEDVVLQVSPAGDLPLVRADPGQMEQVVMNLAVNARDAMPKGGRLTIETRNVEFSGAQTLAQGFAMPPGRYALLTAGDTGAGMGAETMEHLFEPFFTTKEVGKGTGLGLATIYGIVTQSGGFIDVQSEPGRGATFKIFLPAASAAFLEGEGEGEGEKKQRQVEKSRRAILLIEDDESVRRMIRRMLNGAGYAVLEAGTAREALAQSDKEFDLVLTDIVLPDGSGVEAGAKLRKAKPGIEAIYMSGYADNPDIREILSRPENRFLQKPFTAKALLDKVREALA